MILVDSSVWIDWFCDRKTDEVVRLDHLTGRQELGIADLVLVEVLQGTKDVREFERVRSILLELPQVNVGGTEVAVEAARNFQRLRERGVTIHKTIDTLIATRCIMDGHQLLFRDRDFDPFVSHLGLRSALN